ncbi:Flp pilus assembly protein CpaB [Orrella sp. JC864]|uniref:Flp pilus assembly protein CpaB n=1 Tax=Orrella sp. JC864 TaxID=3120298 RepID=UPI00300A9794
MSNISKILAAALVLLALILGLFALRLARQPAPPPESAVQRQAEPQQPQPSVGVVVAARAIEAGRQLTAEDLKVEQWQLAPALAHRDPQPLVGEYVRVALGAGEPVLQSALMRGLSAYLEAGERAVTIPIDEVVGAAGRILPGDRVDVFFSLARGNEVQGTQSRLLQSRVRVLAYGGDSLDGPVRAQDEGEAANRGRNPPAAPRNAILAVPVEQVNELLLATRSGTLQLALRAPEDTQLPDKELFAERAPVLTGRPGLSSEQRARLDEGINKAYAGDSLPALSGPAPAAAPVRTAARPASGGQRSIEVVRAGERENVRY